MSGEERGDEMAREISEQPETIETSRRRWTERLRSLAGRLPLPRPRLPTLRRWQLIALAAFGLLFLMWASVSISFSSIHSAQMFVVEDRLIGIPPPNEFDFGDVPMGVGIERGLTLKNGSPVPTRVTIFVTGNIRDFVEIEDAFFTLRPGEERTIILEGRALVGAEPKKYTGRVVVVQTPWLFPW